MISLFPLWYPPPQTSGRFDISTLEKQNNSFLTHGLTPSMRQSNASAQVQLISFCTQLGKLHSSGSPCPADEWTLCLSATFLAARIQHSSIKVYLSGVRALHTLNRGFQTPLPTASMFRGWSLGYFVI